MLYPCRLFSCLYQLVCITSIYNLKSFCSHYRLSHDGLWFQEGDAASPEPPLRSFGIELMQDVFIVDDNKFIFQLDFSDRKQPDRQHSEAPAPESLVLRATEEGSFDDWIASLSKSMQAAKEDRTTKGANTVAV